MTFYTHYFVENSQGEYKYSSTQVDMPENVAQLVLDFGKSIPDSDIYTDEEDPSYGREDNIHTTILYGIHGEKPDEVDELVKGVKPFNIVLGDISFFDADKYRVMKIEVEGEGLRELYKKFKENTKNTQSFDEYSPHCTIAYVKKDYDDSELDKEKFKNIEVNVNDIIFSSHNKEDIGRIEIPLEG